MCVSQVLTMSKVSKIQFASVQIDKVILLKKYDKYSDIFSEEEVSQLADDIKISHVIDIEESKEPLYKSTYSLSVKELQVLCEYIASSMTKS